MDLYAMAFFLQIVVNMVGLRRLTVASETVYFERGDTRSPSYFHLPTIGEAVEVHPSRCGGFVKFKGGDDRVTVSLGGEHFDLFAAEYLGGAVASADYIRERADVLKVGDTFVTFRTGSGLRGLRIEATELLSGAELAGVEFPTLPRVSPAPFPPIEDDEDNEELLGWGQLQRMMEADPGLRARLFPDNE
jgi:hypothetical protein